MVKITHKTKTKIRWKDWLSIIVLILVIFSVGVYSFKYYTQNELKFTEEDWFIFSFVVFCIILLCVLFIWMIVDRVKLLKLLNRIYNCIVESENNTVEIQRDTQEMIMKLFEKGKK